MHPSAAIHIALPPSIPSLPHDGHTLIQELLIFTNSQLASLLASSFVVFWSTVIHQSGKISSFLDSYLAQCSALLKSTNAATNPILGDHELSRLVFLLILRLALVEEEHLLPLHNWSHHDWAESLYQTHILTIPAIIDFAFVYGNVNSRAVSQTIHAIFHSHPSYLREFLQAFQVLNETVKILERKHEKAANSASKCSKSKGKAKAGSEGIFSGASTTSNILEAAEEAQRELDFLIDAVWTSESTTAVGGMTLSTALLGHGHHSEVMTCLLACYNIANLVQTQYDPYKLAAASSGSRTNSNTRSIDTTTDDLALALCMTLSNRVKAFKGLMLRLLYNLLHQAFFQPCKLDTPDSGDSQPLINPSEASEKLCDLIHILLDQSHFDEPVLYLNGAPLLIDLEVDYDLSDRLRILKNVRLNGDDARIDYILASLEQLLTFSGNAETKRLKMLRKAELQQKMNGLAQSGHSRDLCVENTANTAITSAYPEPSSLDEDHVRRNSLMSQVQDLFPDLGEGFIEACLLAFNDDAELVIMKILEDDLPEYLKKLDRQMSRTASLPPVRASLQRTASTEAVVDYSLVDDSCTGPPKVDADSMLSTRRNIFDGDEFDVFRRKDVDHSLISMGKKDKTSDLYTSRDEDFLQAQKERYLLSTVYDDEYDDTYDSQDIKLAGTVELHSVDELESAVVDSTGFKAVSSAVADAGDSSYAKHQSYLVKMWSSHGHPIFDKSARKTNIRNEMKRVTQFTDEQIEGWFRMLQRDPDRMESVLGPKGIEPNPNHQARDEEESEGSSDTGGQEDTSHSHHPNQQRTSSGHGDGARNNHHPSIESTRGRAFKDRHKARYANHDRKQASWKKHRGAFFGGSRGSGTDSEA
ncbi:hypothetical protein SeMB42_g06565 [Synchytrium endobioticum]|uniref:CUE domain-containing protein n=1 Tax=Synchytrium endobioticum TaxID=286115 RepID=A0A507CR53_9FUNG|nr:hypothetical protein SeMB42_g06565 [Synchytrium endobioticum]TPX41623.1 hypothetical protein SeLEV6574_g05993 [Synchytrium endobioticum]